MDKALPPSEHRSKPQKVYIRLSPSNLPGQEEMFKGHVALRPSINIEELAERLHKNGCGCRPETLIGNYRLMTNEIYNALESGYNVDFDLGRVEISANGSFNGRYDRFDPKRHHCTAVLRPSPRLRQLAGEIHGEVSELGAVNSPWPIHVATQSIMQMEQAGQHAPAPIPAGYDDPLWVYGQRLKIMGDLPEVGVYLTCEETGETGLIPSNKLYINTDSELCFASPLPLTAGEWTLNVCTQYNYRYRLYKKPRMGSITFTVSNDAP